MNEKTRVHLVGISHKGDEMRAEHLLRQNKKTAPHQHPMHEHSKPKLSGGGVKNPVLDNQAEAVNPTAHTPKGSYTYGDGDPGAKAGVRPGADDHMQFKSLEDKGSSIYHRGHV